MSGLLRAGGDESEHLGLPVGEFIHRAGRASRSDEDGAGDPGAEHCAARGDGADATDHLVLAGTLQPVAFRADAYVGNGGLDPRAQVAQCCLGGARIGPEQIASSLRFQREAGEAAGRARQAGLS